MSDQVNDIKSMISRVQKMVDSLPRIAGAGEDWTAFNASQHAHKQALNTVVGELRRMHGARIHVTGSHSRINLKGIKATSTAGGAPLLRNWIAAARRHLEQMEARP